MQPSGCHCNFSRRNESDSKCEDAAGAAWHRWSETTKTTCRTWMDMDGHGTYPIFPFFSKSYSTLQCHMPWHRKSSPFKSTGRSEVLPKLQLENPRGFRQKLWAYGWTNVRNLYDGSFMDLRVFFNTFSFHFHSHLVLSLSRSNSGWHHDLLGSGVGPGLLYLELEQHHPESWWCIQIWQSGTQSRFILWFKFHFSKDYVWLCATFVVSSWSFYKRTGDVERSFRYFPNPRLIVISTIFPWDAI